MIEHPKINISASISIRDAMKQLVTTGKKSLFVTDLDGRLIGSLTDGDIRRAILSGVSLDGTIEGCFNRNPISVTSLNELPGAMAHESAKRLMERHQIEVVPIVDRDQAIIEYVTWTGLLDGKPSSSKTQLDSIVVIMAGGRGTRLEPFTKVLPKPLIPIDDKPIVEHIIDRFFDLGVRDFFLTVNYKSAIMKAFFQELEPAYDIQFVNEPEPMGTAGSLQFIKKKIDCPFFVTNCDIIVNADYRDVMDFHKKNDHSITLVASAVRHQVPYGTCELNAEGSLSKIREKPHYDFMVNTGMYVVDPRVLDLIPDRGIYHMTDLIEDTIASNDTVGVFPVDEDAWIDVGQWNEYKKAVEALARKADLVP